MPVMVNEVLLVLGAGAAGAGLASLWAPLRTHWVARRKALMTLRLSAMGEDLPGGLRRRLGLGALGLLLASGGAMAVAAAPATPIRTVAVVQSATVASARPRPASALAATPKAPSQAAGGQSLEDIDLRQNTIMLDKTMAMLADVRLERIKAESELARAQAVADDDLVVVVDDPQLTDLTTQLDKARVLYGEDFAQVRTLTAQIAGRVSRVRQGLEAHVDGVLRQESRLENEVSELRAERQVLVER